jgi:hypothetical protein
MKFKSFIMILLSLCMLFSCGKTDRVSDVNPAVLESLKQIASTKGFQPYKAKPIIDVGPEGSFDAGALGSMSVLFVDGVFHVYYETWGVRSSAEWDAGEYESLTIGHATSTDGVTWIKDPSNPVLDHGGEADFDRTGVWDPYVIYEDGLYKIWYGGGGGSQPNFGWAYATSEDGSHFKKKGLIGIGNQTGTEDCHVVHDPESGLYYMYYWYGWDEPDALKLVTSPTETGFDFNEARTLTIEGDDSYMDKFCHVLRDADGWHMFYSNFVQPHCPNSIVRYAYSEDGIHWQAKNKRLVKGHDADVLSVTDDLHLMFYSPQNGFDREDTDIRLAIYNGTLPDLATKPPFFEIPESTSIVGQSMLVQVEEDWQATFNFKIEGEVVISEEGDEEDAYTFNAYFEQDGENIRIIGEALQLKGIYDGKRLKLTN